MVYGMNPPGASNALQSLLQPWLAGRLGVGIRDRFFELAGLLPDLGPAFFFDGFPASDPAEMSCCLLGRKPAAATLLLSATALE
jgi:hypothetical protein